MAVGDYEKIEADRRAAWRQMQRAAWGSAEHAELTRQHDAVAARGEQYLRELLARLPFSWYVAHADTGRSTMTYEGGDDHIVVDEPIHIGRLRREPGDALSRPARKFWGLTRKEGRLPTSRADIKIAERIVAGGTTPKKSARQLDDEIAAVLGDKPRSS